MTEWAVVGVIVTLIGLIATLVKPIASLTKAITELTVAVQFLKDDSKTQKDNAKKSHQRLWDYNAEQDNKIENNTRQLINHEGRLKHLEEEKGEEV